MASFASFGQRQCGAGRRDGSQACPTLSLRPSRRPRLVTRVCHRASAFHHHRAWLSKPRRRASPICMALRLYAVAGSIVFVMTQPRPWVPWLTLEYTGTRSPRMPVDIAKAYFEVQQLRREVRKAERALRGTHSRVRRTVARLSRAHAQRCAKRCLNFSWKAPPSDAKRSD